MITNQSRYALELGSLGREVVGPAIVVFVAERKPIGLQLVRILPHFAPQASDHRIGGQAFLSKKPTFDDSAFHVPARPVRLYVGMAVEQTLQVFNFVEDHAGLQDVRPLKGVEQTCRRSCAKLTALETEIEAAVQNDQGDHGTDQHLKCVHIYLSKAPFLDKEGLVRKSSW